MILQRKTIKKSAFGRFFPTPSLIVLPVFFLPSALANPENIVRASDAKIRIKCRCPNEIPGFSKVSHERFIYGHCLTKGGWFGAGEGDLRRSSCGILTRTCGAGKSKALGSFPRVFKEKVDERISRYST